MMRIAMWSGPRNISTAMMRAFENRPDCAVVDEPLYGCYLQETGSDHPGREEIIAAMDCDWRSVTHDLVSGGPEAAVYYQKHMTQHLLPAMSREFVDHLTNAFLIRAPRRIIASYRRIRPSFSLEELGFPQQLELFQRVCDRTGEAPPVLDAALTLENPERVLRQFCERLDIPFLTEMLNWPPGRRDTDGVWAPHWYASVEASTGFAAPAPELSEPRLPPELEQLCEEAERIYAELRPYAIGPGQGVG